MKKQWFYLMGLFTFLPFLSFSQDCGVEDPPENVNANHTPSCVGNGANRAIDYIPSPTDPITEFNVLVVIVQNSSGQSAFSDVYSQDYADFDNMINYMNSTSFNNLPAPAVTNPDPTVTVSDSRIRFKLKDLAYVQKDPSYNNVGSSTAIVANLPSSLASNTLFLIYSTRALSEQPAKPPFGEAVPEGVMMWDHNTPWTVGLLAHEFGHVLGLYHTFSLGSFNDGDGISDTPDDIYVTSAAGCAPLPAGCGCPASTPYPGNICPDNFMGYNTRNYWSPIQIGIMRKTAIENKQYALTNPVSSPLPTAAASGWLDITSSTTWNTHQSISSNVRVKSGATLTITKSVGFLKDAVVEIEPGAELILNCANLYARNGLWTGIRLLGDNTLAQNLQNQGKLTIDNSLVSGASDAIYNGGFSNCTVIPSGGIINVSNSHFLNNLRDIALVKYEPSQAWGHWLADWVDYEASFTNTIFEKNNDFKNPDNLYRGASISLWGVHGVIFDDCEIKNFSAFRDDSSMPGEGLYLLDASIKMNDSEISHYRSGIRSFSSKPILKGSQVNNCRFKNLRYSAYLSGGQLIKFNKNYFWTPRDVPASIGQGQLDIPYGLYFNFTGLTNVEANVFYGGLGSNYSTASNAISTGLIFNNHGDLNEVVYGNRFSNNGLGIEALGQNRDQNGWNGLQFRCNEFINTTTDIYVKGTLNNSLDGIRENQGDLVSGLVNHTDMTGNLFSNGSGHIWDFNNENTPQVNYHHHDRTSNPNVEAIPSQGVLNFDNDQLDYDFNACPTRLIVQPESGDTLPELDYPLAQAETDFEQHTAEADSLEVVLHQLVDGGNTYALQGEIYFTPQHEHFELYSNLIDESPYLSDAVLTDIIELDDFDELMLRNILVANPQSAKNQQLMDLLGEEHPDMPQYMIDDIKTGQDNFGAMELVEGDLAYHRQRQHFAAKRLLDLYVNDENHFSEAEEAVRHLLRQLRTPSFQYMRAQMELELGNLTEARQVIDSVPLLCALQDDEALVHARAESYFDLQFDRAGNEQAVCDYSPAQLQSLQNLSAGDHIAGAWSRATLELLGQAVTYQEPLYLPGTTSGKRAESHQFPQVARPLNRLYPNPARKQVSVGLGEIPLARKVEVQLFDLSGRQVKSQPMAGAETQVSLKGIAPGTYLLGVYADGNRIFEDKLIILE